MTKTMRNCLQNISILTGTAGVTSCPNCDENSYYYTVIGESTFDVPNSSPVVPVLVDDGVEPMLFTAPYSGKVIVEFTCNVKRLIVGTGAIEGIIMGVYASGALRPESMVGCRTLGRYDQYDLTGQTVPFDVVAGDVIELRAGTGESTAEKLHQVLNHNMRVIFIERS